MGVLCKWQFAWPLVVGVLFGHGCPFRLRAVPLSFSWLWGPRPGRHLGLPNPSCELQSPSSKSASGPSKCGLWGRGIHPSLLKWLPRGLSPYSNLGESRRPDLRLSFLPSAFSPTGPASGPQYLSTTEVSGTLKRVRCVRFRCNKFRQMQSLKTKKFILLWFGRAESKN